MNILILLASIASPVTAPLADVLSPPAFEVTAALDDGMLDKATARADVSQVATSEQTSRVSNNVINGDSVTGGVSIDGNAFQNLQGLSIINSNSGNNVSINASLNVNLQFSPAP